MPAPAWLKDSGKWLGGVIAGVLITTVATLYVTSYFERPRPAAEIAQIGISDSSDDLTKTVRKKIVSVPLNEDLFKELAQSTWTESFRDPSDDLSKVVARLNRNRELVENFLKHAESYEQLKREMLILLNGERSARAAETFFDDWQQVDGFIYGSVRSQMRYGSSALRLLRCGQETSESHLRKLTYQQAPDAQYFAKAIADIRTALSQRSLNQSDQPEVKQSSDPKPEPPIIIVSPSDSPFTNKQHIYSVMKIGGKYKSRFDLRSNLDENEIVTTDEDDCAENVMAALADFDKEKLNAILEITDQEFRNVELHRKIEQEIEQYIKGYSFWNVSVIVSNRGKSPISSSPNTTLYVDMSGTKINDGSNLAVGLRAISKDGDNDTIIIPGGESRSVEFVSSDLINHNKDWKNVISAFVQSSRNCIVVLYPQTGEWQQDKAIVSPIKNFGPPAATSPTEAQNVSAYFANRHDVGLLNFSSEVHPKTNP